MNLQEKIYKKLDGLRGKSISGEELAAEFGVSRAAVWKAIKSLQKEGFEIQAATNRGYSLLPQNDLLTASGIEKFLKTPFFLQVLEKTGSTNDEAKRLAQSGAPEWTAVIAEEQSEGRGRFSRSFYSPRGAGLYMSVVLRPKFSAADTLFITTSAAVAVCEAIERVSGEKCSVKWVNDVYMRGKKVCGILTEASFNVESGGLDYAVVGIGINVKECAFPPELESVATSVFRRGEYLPETRAKLAAALLESFRRYYDAIPERSFYAEYKRRSFILGKRVSVSSGSVTGEGVAAGLDENCFLEVRFDNGEVKKLSSGEVSVRVKT